MSRPFLRRHPTRCVPAHIANQYKFTNEMILKTVASFKEERALAVQAAIPECDPIIDEEIASPTRFPNLESNSILPEDSVSMTNAHIPDSERFGDTEFASLSKNTVLDYDDFWDEQGLSPPLIETPSEIRFDASGSFDLAPSFIHTNEEISNSAWDDDSWNTVSKVTLESAEIKWKYIIQTKHWHTGLDEPKDWISMPYSDFFDRIEANLAAEKRFACYVRTDCPEIVQSYHYHSSDGLSGYYLETLETFFRLQVKREAMPDRLQHKINNNMAKQAVWEVIKTVIKSIPSSPFADKNHSPCKRKEVVESIEPVGPIYDNIFLANCRAKDFIAIAAADSVFKHGVSTIPSGRDIETGSPFEVSMIIDSETRILIQVRERALEIREDPALHLMSTLRGERLPVIVENEAAEKFEHNVHIRLRG
jgi:hypothetical protein